MGTSELAPQGWWMAAVLACGEGACLSHESAAQHLGIRPIRRGPIHVTVPPHRNPRLKGIREHRRTLQPSEITTHDRIPTTTPVIALMDLASQVTPPDLDRAIGDADKINLIDPETLRRALDELAGRSGVRIVRKLLDRHTYVLTHTELERRFLAIVRRAGLPLPEGQRRFGPTRVDFFWPSLNLVVETDGLTYHRTAAQQSEDLRRDHEHAAAGLRTLRFSHAQIRYEPRHVESTPAAVLTGLTAFP